MSKIQTRSVIYVGVVIVVVVAVVVGILLASHKSNKGGLSTSQVAAAKAQINSNWQKFFAASTTLSDREKLLQNGSQFADAMQQEFSALGSASSSAGVTSINVTSKDKASVTYTVYLNKQPVLNNQTGQALLINNTWVVSDSTLCGLLNMGGSRPSVCQAY